MTSANQDDFQTLLHDAEGAQKLAAQIAARHGLAGNIAPLPGGSRPLFSIGGRYALKIFPAEESEFYKTESIFLARLEGHLPLATPPLVASDSWEGLPYIVMGHLDGTPLNSVWDGFSRAEKLDLATQLGAAVRSLHDLPPDLFSDAPFKWEPIIAHQRATLIQTQRELGLGEEWLSQLPAYTAAHPFDLFEAGPFVPLHTELMPEHLFVRKDGERWRLAGLLDFEPSMLGPREYEFAAVGLFITRGDPELFRPFLSSYGYVEQELNRDLSRRIMAFLLLHRYCNLRRFIELVPPEGRPANLEGLEQYWFGM